MAIGVTVAIAATGVIAATVATAAPVDRGAGRGDHDVDEAVEVVEVD